jgi:hypothetical protein
LFSYRQKNSHNETDKSFGNFFLVASLSISQESSFFNNPVICGDMADLPLSGWEIPITRQQHLPNGLLFTGIYIERYGQLGADRTYFRRAAGMDFDFVLGTGVVLSQ